MKPNYLIIPLVAILTAAIGSRFTAVGVGDWYPTLELPAWTPPGSVIGAVWTAIYALATGSALLLWNRAAGRQRAAIAAAFIVNAGLNALWSWLFFAAHLIGAAAWEAVALEASVLILIALAWPVSRLAAFFLMPYAAWVAFATYLTFTVAALNR